MLVEGLLGRHRARLASCSPSIWIRSRGICVMHRRRRYRCCCLVDALRGVAGGVRERVRAGRDAATSTPTSPRIGLVLSGGGARGGAHIGVLKALEELRVPVDRIAGTSIGAVVGGFYVSGMSVAELEQSIESLEWETAFLNVTPRQLKSFRRKRDDDSFLVNQKPGLNDGEFELPDRARAGSGHRHDHLARDVARVAGRQFRPARGSVPRRGRRPRDGRGRRARRRQSRACDSRQHVDSGGALADRDRRALARRRRHREESARRRRSRDGRRSRDRRGHFDGFDESRHSALGARRHVAAHELADARRHARGPAPADGQRRFGLADVRRGLGLRGLHANARNRSERLRRGHAAARGLRAPRSQRAAVRRVHCGAHRSAHEGVARRRVRPPGQRSTRRRQRRRSAARRDQARASRSTSTPSNGP